MTGELAARRLPARTHAGPAPGFSAFTPGGGKEGEPRPHCGEEEDAEEGGREQTKRPGAGGGGLATFSPPPRERPRHIHRDLHSSSGRSKVDFLCV